MCSFLDTLLQGHCNTYDNVCNSKYIHYVNFLFNRSCLFQIIFYTVLWIKHNINNPNKQHNKSPPLSSESDRLLLYFLLYLTAYNRYRLGCFLNRGSGSLVYISYYRLSFFDRKYCWFSNQVTTDSVINPLYNISPHLSTQYQYNTN